MEENTCGTCWYCQCHEGEGLCMLQAIEHGRNNLIEVELSEEPCGEHVERM